MTEGGTGQRRVKELCSLVWLGHRLPDWRLRVRWAGWSRKGGPVQGLMGSYSGKFRRQEDFPSLLYSGLGGQFLCYIFYM